MTLTETLQEQRAELVERMLALSSKDNETSEAEVRQFLEGFVALLTAASAGDSSPRDEYLATVIPAIRDAGMPLAVVMDGMVRVGMVAAAFLDREHLPWLTEFCAMYTTDLINTWEGR